MGIGSQINTARDVHLGDEVGVGIGSRVFTHGSYLSEWDGFPVDFAPVTIGSRVWLPQATVLPGVTIGDDVVVAAGSLVCHDVPAGSLVAGIPARVVRERSYPHVPSDRQGILERIVVEAKIEAKVTADEIICGNTRFDVAGRTITGGPITLEAERLRQQLRRHGIRFRYSPARGFYRPWDDA
jgi:hypothetical protein